jgi:hypothetical protein
MRTRLIWAFFSVATLLAVPTIAGASGSSSTTPHPVKLSGLRDGLWSNSGSSIFGLPGAKIMITGTASGTIGGTPTGQGAFYEKGTVISLTKWKGHGVYLFANGSISFNERTVKNTPKSYILTAIVTGGTGAYKDASGKLTISGKARHFLYDEDVSSNNVTGTLNY